MQTLAAETHARFTVFANTGLWSSRLIPCLFVYNPGLERGKRVRWEEWIATNLTRTVKDQDTNMNTTE